MAQSAQGEHGQLVRQWDRETQDTVDAQLAHPTPDHWLPLIYAAGAANENDHVSFPTEGFDLGSLSMRNVIFG